MATTLVPAEASTPPPEFEKGEVDDAVFARTVGEVHRILGGAGVPYGMCGGLASAVLGRPRYTKDIDLLVAPSDAERALEALEAGGFATHRTNPAWLYKATRDGVLVDVLFRAKGDLYFDDEAQRRARDATFHDEPIRVIAPEDFVVIKAVVFDEETPRHWFDAAAVLAHQQIDWEYLGRRALEGGPRRVLALLAFAQSIDVAVPDAAVRRLVDMAYPT